MKRILLVTGSAELAHFDASERWARHWLRQAIVPGAWDVVLSAGALRSPDAWARQRAEETYTSWVEYLSTGMRYGSDRRSEPWHEGDLASALETRMDRMIELLVRLRDTEGWAPKVLGLIATWAPSVETIHTLEAASLQKIEVVSKWCEKAYAIDPVVREPAPRP